MRHLYVIGNGFDVHHHIPSRYLDFKKWVEENDYDTISKLDEILGVWSGDDIWWNDFETNLGDVSVVKEYTENVAFENQPDYGSDDYRDRDLYDAQIKVERDLGGLIENLKDDFQKWASLLPAGEYERIVKVEQKDAFFLTFNYSLTLESLYTIPASQILHIHGVAKDKESIVVGHGRSYSEIREELDNDIPNPPENLSEEEYDEWCTEVASQYEDDYPSTQAKDAAADAVYSIRKDVEGIITRNKRFFDSIAPVEFVHIYGFSFAQTDIPYIDAILSHISAGKVSFEVSWYSDRDKERIQSFFADRVGKYSELQLIRMDDIMLNLCPKLF